MARKYSSKNRMKNKIEPAVQTLVFATPTVAPGAQGTFFIDLSQAASLLNRRFYRQGINWAVGGFKFLSGAGFAGSISLSKLPNTWVMSNAWEKGMRTWTKMNNEALAETESIRPRFLDFKIYADARHQAAGFGANLLPVSSGDGFVASIAQAGEWVPSKIVVPFGPSLPGNTTDFEIMAVGANYDGAVAPVVSLIEGYAASRGLPNVLDPNAPADAEDVDGSTPENWMAAVFNEGTDQTSEVILDMTSENNIAPYPFENDGVNTDTMYPGGANQLVGLQIHSIQNVSLTTIGGTTRIKGGNFPCGLIAIDAINSGDIVTNLIVEIDLVPGSHRGYLCEPMTEM